MEGPAPAYRELGRLLDDLGLKRTSSMAFMGMEVNPVSDDPKCRQAAKDNLKWLIECAHALDASVICGPMYRTMAFSRVTVQLRPSWRGSPRSCGAWLTTARNAGVTLAMEPLNRFECYVLNTLADGAALTNRVGHPNVGILFDTFHANIEGPCRCDTSIWPGHQALPVAIVESGTGSRGLARFVPSPAFGRLRRLAGDRGFRTSPARSRGGDKNLARPV